MYKLAKILKLILRMNFIYIFILLACFCANYVLAKDFTTQAKYAIAIDAVTGDVLYEHNANIPMSPFSMSKLVTLYVIFDKLKDGSLKGKDKFIVSKEAWKRGGTTMFLRQGQKVSIDNLIKGVAIVSGNDASITLAESIKGSLDSFVFEMNKYAKILNLNNSNFVNPSGWPEENHYMSAHDIALVAKRLFDDFSEHYYVFSEKKFEFNGITQNNTNALLSQKNTLFKCDGIKTGSGHNEFGIVISAVNKNENRIFVVVNNLETSKKRFEEASNITAYIFDNFAFKTLYKKGEILEYANVHYGKEKKVALAVDQEVFAAYPINATNNVQVILKYNALVKAPISKGQQLGSITLKISGRKDKEFPLYSKQDVEEISFFRKMLYNVFTFSNKNL